jgi:hypothetical protein
MRILKAILLAPVRIIVFAIQLVLRVGVVIFGAAGGIITKAGEIVGGLLILGSLLCVATGQITGDIFFKMFLGGVAFGAIPAAITKLGEEGILGVKEAISRL